MKICFQVLCCRFVVCGKGLNKPLDLYSMTFGNVEKLSSNKSLISYKGPHWAVFPCTYIHMCVKNAQISKVMHAFINQSKSLRDCLVQKITCRLQKIRSEMLVSLTIMRILSIDSTVRQNNR